MFKRIRKTYYKFLLDKKLRRLDAQKLFKVMVEYDKLYGRPVTPELNLPYPDEIVGFQMGDNYDIFYKNVHLHYMENAEHVITRISIKQDDVKWKIGSKFSEDNESMEVFLTYDIEVLGGLRCTNTINRFGNWNEYVYKCLLDIEDQIYEFTRESSFNKAYDYTVRNTKNENE